MRQDICGLPLVKIVKFVSPYVDGSVFAGGRVIVVKGCVDVADLKEIKLLVLPNLEIVIFKFCDLILDEEVGALEAVGVQVEEELVVQVGLERVHEVIQHKYLVDEWETQCLLAYVLIYELLRFADNPRSVAWLLNARIISVVLALEERNVHVRHLACVKVPNQLIAVILHTLHRI